MTIFLNLIMKNESSVLRRLLTSIMPIIDGGIVVDTGSTDNSKQIVKDIFKEFNKPVEIFDYPFTNFADTRNFALSKIKGKCDFGFLIDADEELIIKEGFDIKNLKEKLSKHDIGISEVNFGTRYGRRNFFRTSKNFYWQGAVHEILLCDEETRNYLIDGLETVVHTDGHSWSSQTEREKYLGHARILEEEVNKHNRVRDIFYLSQSYRDAGEHLKSIEWYRKRVERTDGFFEERYFSQYSIGNLYRDIAKFPEAVLEWMRCFELDDMKAEHLTNLIMELQDQKCHTAAYIFSKYGMEKYYNKNPYPTRQLFLKDGSYGHHLLALHLQNCKMLNKEGDIKMIRKNMTIDEFFNSVTSAWTGHKEFAKWLVGELNPSVICDLGVDYGYSTYCLALAKKGKVYGIDNFKGDSFTGIRNTHEFVKESLEYLKSKGINNIEIINGDFDKVAYRWHKKIDILHIDEIPTNIEHSYKKWASFVKEDGVILLHNTQVYSEVKNFFNKCEDVYKYEFKQSGGLGVISKDKNIIDKIKDKYSPDIFKNKLEPKHDITIAYINYNSEAREKYLTPSINNLNRAVKIVTVNSSDGMPAHNYNRLLEEATTKYVLFVHEDVTFSPDFLDRADIVINTHPDFGAIGVVGNYKNNIEWGTSNEIKEVITCDGCCILVNKDHGLRFDSETFNDYHLYVDDYFKNCESKGLKNYTIPIDASEANISDAYTNKGSYFKHYSQTVAVRGYAWGKYWEYLKKLEQKWADKPIGFDDSNLNAPAGPQGEKGMWEVDVCILSYAKTDELRKVTERGIETLLTSEQNVKFNVFIMEGNKQANYDNFPNTKTFYTDLEFNYNAYLNILVKEGKSEFVCLCNNDLTYERGWAFSIIQEMKRNPLILSASPFCPQIQNKRDFPDNAYFGTTIRRELAGWCIFQQRKIYDFIQQLDEGVSFWYSDCLYGDQLIHNKISHALITKSIVNHHENNLGVSGEKILSNVQKYQFTNGQYDNYLKAREALYNSHTVLDFYA